MNFVCFLRSHMGGDAEQAAEDCGSDGVLGHVISPKKMEGMALEGHGPSGWLICRHICKAEIDEVGNPTKQSLIYH